MADLIRTPEADAEVRRNLARAFGLLGGIILIIVLVLGVAINPPGGSEGYHIAWLLLTAFALPGLVVVGGCLVLAYPMGDWPGFMRAARLASIYGIDAGAVSNEGMRRWMGRRGYWAAFARGAAVASAFVVPWILITWAGGRRRFPEGLVFPTLLMIINAGGVAAKAWVVRRLVADRPEAGDSSVGPGG